MLVTLDGIVTLVSPLQDWNAESPMLVMLLPLIKLGMTKPPTGLLTNPVTVIVSPLSEYLKFPSGAGSGVPIAEILAVLVP